MSPLQVERGQERSKDVREKKKVFDRSFCLPKFSSFFYLFCPSRCIANVNHYHHLYSELGHGPGSRLRARDMEFWSWPLSSKISKKLPTLRLSTAFRAHEFAPLLRTRQFLRAPCSSCGPVLSLLLLEIAPIHSLLSVYSERDPRRKGHFSADCAPSCDHSPRTSASRNSPAEQDRMSLLI